MTSHALPHSYEPVIGAIRERWRLRGILNSVPAADAEVRAFEARYGVVLPADLRFYFTTVNGTASGRYGMDDPNDLMAFWHLDQVETFAAVGEGGGPQPGRSAGTYALADYSIWVYGIGIQLSADPRAPTPLVADFMRSASPLGSPKYVADLGRPFVHVAGSFTEFADAYLRDALTWEMDGRPAD
jgi:hypothetical protein